jgi:hypothetical protein
MILIWLRRRPIIHSAILAVLLSVLTGTAVTILMVATGDVGFEANLCVESQGDSEFDSVSWYMEGYDCPLQWWSMYSVVISFSIVFSPPFLMWMVGYNVHRYALAREPEWRRKQQEREEARADQR